MGCEGRVTSAPRCRLRLGGREPRTVDAPRAPAGGRRADALARQRGNQGQPGIVHGRSVGRALGCRFPQMGAPTSAVVNLGDALGPCRNAETRARVL